MVCKVGFGKEVGMASNQIMGRKEGQNISSPLSSFSGTASLAVVASLHSRALTGLLLFLGFDTHLDMVVLLLPLTPCF